MLGISASQIRAARAMLAMKQSELAKLAGVSLATLNNIEREIGDPRISTLNAIQQALETVGIMMTQTAGSQSVSLQRMQRFSIQNSFQASERLLKTLSQHSELKPYAVYFFAIRDEARPTIFSTGQPAGQQTTQQPIESSVNLHRLGMMIKGKRRTLLVDKTEFSMHNPKGAAEIAGIMLAALVSLAQKQACFYCKLPVNETGHLAVEDATTQIDNYEWTILENPVQFLTKLCDFQTLYRDCAAIKDHPLLQLLDFCNIDERARFIEPPGTHHTKNQPDPPPTRHSILDI